jgi:hypothetical protein
MYLIDSDVLIDAKNRHYGFDIVPGFWEWLENAHLAGSVFVVQKVADEVQQGGDELASWMKRQPGSFKIQADASDQPSLKILAEWVNDHPRYTASAKSTFLSAGDYFLVAQARNLSYVVVTQETPQPDSKGSIKIPDACTAVGVTCTTPFEMLRREGASFR